MCIGLWVCCRETATVTVKMSVCERSPPPELCDHTQVKQMTFKQENSRLLLLTFLLREEEWRGRNWKTLKKSPTEETVLHSNIYWGKSNQVWAVKYAEVLKLQGAGGVQTGRELWWRKMRWRRWRRKRKKWWWRQVDLNVWRDNIRRSSLIYSLIFPRDSNFKLIILSWNIFDYSYGLFCCNIHSIKFLLLFLFKF